MYEIFFEELHIPKPDIILCVGERSMYGRNWRCTLKRKAGLSDGIWGYKFEIVGAIVASKIHISIIHV